MTFNKKSIKLLISKSRSTLLDPHDGTHSLFDDMQGILTGLLLMAVGIIFFKSAEIYSGGVTGITLVAYYWFDIPLGIGMVLLNMPFFVLSYFRMGKEFTLKSLVTIILLSLLITIIPEYMLIDSINPYFAALTGGLFVGVGLIQIFRHRSSTGGLNVLVLYLQKKNGWNAGLVQMVLDFCVIGLSVFSGSAEIVIASFLGAFAVNFTIAVNHRPGRYISF